MALEKSGSAVPAPNTIIANAAPKAAECDIPRVNGEASGFLSMLCITMPETANPMPASIADKILGIRISQKIVDSIPVPLANNPERILSLSILTVPIKSEMTAKIKSRIMQTDKKITFFLHVFYNH